MHFTHFLLQNAIYTCRTLEIERILKLLCLSIVIFLYNRAKVQQSSPYVILNAFEKINKYRSIFYPTYSNKMIYKPIFNQIRKTYFLFNFCY